MNIEKTEPYLEETAEGCRIKIKAQPRASRNEVVGVLGDALKVRVTAPPVDSAANQALRDLLAKKFKTPKSSIELIQGETSRNKVFFVHGMNAKEVAKLIWY